MSSRRSGIVPWGRAAVLAIIAVGVVATGCRPDRAAPSPSGAGSKSLPESPRRSEPKSNQREEKPRHPAQVPSSTGKPRRFPSPTAECGHVVAFAGFSTTVDGDNGGTLLYCDPGDNILAGTGHLWEVNPGGSPVICGTRRPTIVLAGAGAFTVMGAVFVSPLTAAESSEVIVAPDPWMPDLSQSLDGKVNALCGPTSAADVLYAIAGRRPQVLAGYRRGPAPEADGEVRRLLIGSHPGKEVGGLAAIMQIRGEKDGTTPITLVAGMESWLEDSDPGAWTSALLWLDDEPRPKQEQLRFLQTLAAVQRRGGGAVLFLWPGSEFADGSVADAEAAEGQAKEHPSSPTGRASGDGEVANVPDAANSREPAGRKTASKPPRIPGGRGFSGAAASPENIAKAAKTAEAALEAAKSAINGGRWDQAAAALKKAMEAAGPHASVSEGCLEILDEANALAERLNRSRPHTADRRGSERMTEFD